MSVITKYLNPKNQVAFKHIFDADNNQDILVAMLNAVLKRKLHQPIQDVAWVQTSRNTEVEPNEKDMLQLICRDQDRGKYIIMVKMISQKDIPPSLSHDIDSPYVKAKDEEDIYKGSQEVIFLAFTDYILFANPKAYKNQYVISTKLTSKSSFDRLISIIVELPKFSQQCTTDIAQLSLEEKFYYFLDKVSSMQDKELAKLIGQDKILQKACRMLDRFSWPKEKLAIYEKQEKGY